jgi:AraC-like DNA-binding protein
MDYIHQLRVDAAKQLIMQGCSVKHAMSLVGYSNPLTMSRAFKKLDGSTPGQYAPTGKLSS